jgi:prepilin-type N-terminal cleavage/methylation domain-containing protein
VKQKGFTLVELLIVILVTSVFVITMFTFFKSSLFGYLDMQKTATNFTDLATQSQRVAQVVRGSTDLISAQDYSAEMYAYFYPTDTYVSDIKYYLNTDGTKLMADVTPMTANPPIGTAITANKKTYTIIGAFKKQTGIKLFEYLSSGGTAITTPISDLHTIKGIRINLASLASGPSGDQVMTLEVNLRNRKTNL